jgi:hypothetical protein
MTATNKVASCASMSVPTAGQKRLVIVGATGMGVTLSDQDSTLVASCRGIQNTSQFSLTEEI